MHKLKQMHYLFGVHNYSYFNKSNETGKEVSCQLVFTALSAQIGYIMPQK